MDGTSETDLVEMAKALKIPNFKGVFTNDQIKHIKRTKNLNFIAGYCDSNEPGVTHWIAVIILNNHNYFFDSYGNDPPDAIREFLGPNITRSTYQIQNYNTYSCGQFCILVIYLLVVKGMTFVDIILNMFDTSEKYNKRHKIVNNVGE
jgi:hypothetical protein